MPRLSPTANPVELRPARSDDLPALLHWVDSAAMLVQWAGPNLFRWPLDHPQLQAWVDRARASTSESRLLAATLAPTESVAGFVELAAVDREAGSAVLARVIVDPARRGVGLGERMVREAVGYGFRELDLRRISLRVYDVNPAAVRCYEKAGFRLEQRLPAPQPVGEERWGVLVMGIERPSRVGERSSRAKKDTSAHGPWAGARPETDARVEIRRLGDGDEAAACARLMARSEPWTTLGRSYGQSLRLITDPTRETWVALQDGRLTGFVVLTMAGAFVGYVQSVCVAPEVRGCGVGTRLMAFAEERILRETQNVFLCVSSFNSDAQRLYERLGYEVVGRLRDYLVRGHDEILMRKSTGPLGAASRGEDSGEES